MDELKERLSEAIDFSDPLTTELRLGQLLGHTEWTAEEVAEIQTQIARCRGLQGDYAGAESLLEECRNLADEPGRVRVRWLLEFGRVLNSSGRQGEAVPVFEQAVAAADEAAEAAFAVDALHMLAIAAPLEKQAIWAEVALARIEQSDDAEVTRWLGPVLNNLGWTYADLGDWGRAIPVFQRALEYRLKAGSPKTIALARSALASCLLEVGRHAEALAVLEPVPEGLADDAIKDTRAKCHEALGRTTQEGGQ